ncbi:MAG: BT_3987 domain-containing protein [Muribaculaceae bacterium]
MKFKNIFLALGGALLLSCSMTSCSDEEEYDFDGIAYTRVYFNNATTLTQGAVVKTPVGNFTSLDGEKTIKTTAPTTKAIQVKFAIDNSLIDAYNEKNGTEYIAAPDGLFSLSTNQLTIEADTTASKEGIALTISEAGIEQLEPGNEYLIPVIITDSSDANYRPSTNVGFAYYLVSVTSKLIDDNGSLDGLTILDKTDWSITSSDTGVTNLQNIIDGVNSTYARFSKGTDVSITFDLGKETAFKGIEIYEYYYFYGIRNASIDYSLDGETWSGIGDIQYRASSTIPVVLYGSVQARYVRLKIADFFYSSYPSYCRLYEFSLYN